MYQLFFDLDKNFGVLLYFISFMQLSNLIFINIIIAFVIDTYVQIEETLALEAQARKEQRK